MSSADFRDIVVVRESSMIKMAVMGAPWQGGTGECPCQHQRIVV
jgi:hypothetical protein